MLDIRLTDIARLEDSVLEYEKVPVQENMILFYGDSGFTRWHPRYGNPDLEQEICMKDGSQAVINHGFGTSTAEEQLYYYNRMVRPWKPRALVLMSYCNDRDLAYSPAEIVALQARLMAYARKDIPGIRFFVCDARPVALHMDDLCWMSWSNHLLEYNQLIAQYCEKYDDCTLVRHIDSPLFFNDPKDVGDYAKIRRDVFVEDQVHYNPQGYALYKEFFTNILDHLL